MVLQPLAMSPKRRFISALFGGRLDAASPANPTSIATTELMEAAGAHFPDAHLNPEKMAALAGAGFDAFHFDSKVNARQALEIAGNRITLIGNVNNPGTLLLGTPDEVKAEVRRLLDAGIRVVGPECAVPLTTPNSNLAAIPEAVKEYYRSRS